MEIRELKLLRDETDNVFKHLLSIAKLFEKKWKEKFPQVEINKKYLMKKIDEENKVKKGYWEWEGDYKNISYNRIKYYYLLPNGTAEIIDSFVDFDLKMEPKLFQFKIDTIIKSIKRTREYYENNK